MDGAKGLISLWQWFIPAILAKTEDSSEARLDKVSIDRAHSMNASAIRDER